MTDDQPATGPADDTTQADAIQADPGGTPVSEDAEPSTGRRRALPTWRESLLLVGAAVLVAVLIKALLVQAFYIPSASMEPGLVRDDRILVQKPSYWFGGEPSRGDVVVFEDPGGWLGVGETGEVTGFRSVLSAIGLYPSGGHLVKRVVGVAGDTITCCDEEGRISVNDAPLDEDYLAPRVAGVLCNGPMISTCDWSAGPVPEGTVFVMGDNRANSGDSSDHLCLVGETDCTDNPFVDTDLVVGKVLGVVWPLGNAGLVSSPDNFADVPDAG